MKFGFIAKHRGIWPVERQCEALGVSRSGFFRRARKSVRPIFAIESQIEPWFALRRLTRGVCHPGHIELASDSRCLQLL